MRDLTIQQYLIIEWIFVGICLFFVIARLAVRTWKHMWTYWLSEVWLITGVMFFIGLVIASTYTISNGWVEFGARNNVTFNKWQFAVCLLCDLVYYFPRFSLLAFYNELFPISEERLRKCLYVLMAYNACAFIAVFLSNLLWCGVPVSKNWSTNPQDCALFLTSDIFKITWPLNISAEILVFALPFGMIHRLKTMPKREKISLICLFSIGIINIILSICRFSFAMGSIFTYSTTVVTSAEIVSQIVVCAAPALRPLLPFIITFCSTLAGVVTGGTATRKPDDERSLQGSFSTSGMREKNAGQLSEGNVAELREWGSRDGNITDASPYHSQV